MRKNGDFLQSVDAIYDAGLHAEHWPDALASITQTVGGIAGTLEVFDRKSAMLTEFHSHGLPQPNEIAYFDHYCARNPRVPLLINGSAGGIVTDYMVFNERGMNRNAFYSDFPVPRRSECPPYIVSVYPAVEPAGRKHEGAGAYAIMFVHDPLNEHQSSVQLLRAVFGLTEAEAHITQALQAAMSPGDYAKKHGLSRNTVYTHLRKIKEKTNCRRQSELIRKLSEVKVWLRRN